MQSAPQIGASLGLTRAACRYHLAALEAAGLVERVAESEQQPAQRGRPQLLYRRVAQDAPEALAALCGVLLNLLPASEEMLPEIAEGLAAGTSRSGHATRRLNEAVARINALGGQARWMAAARGPQLLIRRCPFAGLVQSHPELCRVEILLLERVVGQAPLQTASHCAGQPQCVFAWNGAES